MKVFLNILLISVTLGSATFANATSFLDKIGNALDKVDKALGTPPQNSNQQPGYSGGQDAWNNNYNPPVRLRVTSGVNYRSCAGKNCRKLGTLQKGTIVQASQMVNGWYNINGMGYVYKQYLTPDAGYAPRAQRRPAQSRNTSNRASTYITIAFSESTGVQYTAWGTGSQADGDRKATQGCNQDTHGRNDCAIAVNGWNTCASLAGLDMGNYYGAVAQTDPNRYTAQSKALRECKQSAGRNCELLVTKCSSDPT